jgi:hypothetical protein
LPIPHVCFGTAKNFLIPCQEKVWIFDQCVLCWSSRPTAMYHSSVQVSPEEHSPPICAS